VGRSQHAVGDCLSGLGQLAEALPWYERAVVEKEKGDEHGRIHPDSLGNSLRAVAECLSSLGRAIEARQWYERSALEEDRGSSPIEGEGARGLDVAKGRDRDSQQEV